jgi:two-component system sensor histidine kinase BaeS
MPGHRRSGPHRRRSPGQHRHGGWPPHKRHRPPSGLRRRLTFAFAFVALAAVTITTWFTLGALFEAQRALVDAIDVGGGSPWDDPRFAAARQAFGRATRTALFAGLISFFLASAAAGIVTRLLTRPLVALTAAARRLEAGERGVRLTPPPSHDEVSALTEAFNHLGEGLERQEAWRRSLVADIAHDLRTPLSVLRSEIEAMQDGVVATDDAALERLHGEVLRLSRLVDDLRTLSLAEGGGVRLALTSTDIGPFLEGIAGGFAARAAEVGSAVHVAAPAGLTLPIDPDRLQRLLANLIDNALRYAAPGTVEIAATPDGEGGVQISVSDDGPGLSDEALERAFERFYRGDPSRTRRAGSGGSGLGLAIARAQAEAHGGRLDAQNRPEGGATFTLSLPRLPTADDAPAAP